MCKCNPCVRTPFCGKPGCEWPKQKSVGEGFMTIAQRLRDAADMLADHGAQPHADVAPAALQFVALQLRKAAAELDAQPAPVPDGWKLVSRRVTQSMVQAGAETPGIKKIDAQAALTQFRCGAHRQAPDPDFGTSWHDCPLAQAWAAMYDACPDPNTPVVFGPEDEHPYVPPPALDWSDADGAQP